MTGTAVAKADQWRQQLAQMEPQFQRALPSHIDPARFVRATETAVMRDQALLDCDRKSLFQAVMQSAESGLMPNGRDAALVRFKNQVQFIPMIGGILRLMRNTGEVQSIVAEVVCEHDEFDYRLGDDPHISHKPAMADRGEVVGAYAILKTKDGGVYREFMARSEIDKVKGISRAGANGPWAQWYSEMARKTVLRRLAKKCPLSTDTLMDLTSRDDAMYDLSAVEQPPSKHDRIRQMLRGEPAEDVNQEPATEPEDEPQEEAAAEAPQDAQDAEVEEVEAEPAAEEVPVSDPSGAIYGSPSEALGEMQRTLATFDKVADVNDYGKAWAEFVKSSFDECSDVLAKGRNMVAIRKAEIQKGKAA